MYLFANLKLYPESFTYTNCYVALRKIVQIMYGWHHPTVPTRMLVLNCPARPPRRIYMVQNHCPPTSFLSPFSSIFCSGYEPDVLLCFATPVVCTVSCCNIPRYQCPVSPALPCQSTLFVAFVVYDARRQEAGRLDCCFCFKTKDMDKRPSAVAASAIDQNAEWVGFLGSWSYLGVIFLSGKS